ncbi:MAG: outer membrane beta-barrel protein [Nitrospiraceae bacterium]|nr:outer membrane beta-barrel protein [Nitrospiraceae bacterium]
MGRVHIRAFVVAFILLAGPLLFSSIASARSGYYAQQGLYVTGSGTYTNLEGGLDGHAVYQYDYSPFTALVIAKPSSAFGWGAGAGYRFSFYAIEINYYQSRHNDSYYDYVFDGNGNLLTGPGNSQSTLETLSLDFKLYANARKQLQPYILGGVGYSWLYQRDRVIYPVTGNTRFANFGPNVGAGIAYYITPKLALDAGFIYRYLHFTTVKAYGGSENELGQSIDENAFTARAGVSYTFDLGNSKNTRAF